MYCPYLTNMKLSSDSRIWGCKISDANFISVFPLRVSEKYQCGLCSPYQLMPHPRLASLTTMKTIWSPQGQLSTGPTRTPQNAILMSTPSGYQRRSILRRAKLTKPLLHWAKCGYFGTMNIQCFAIIFSKAFENDKNTYRPDFRLKKAPQAPPSRARYWVPFLSPKV